MDHIENELTSQRLDLAITYSFIIEKMNLSCYKYTSRNLFQENICAVINKDWPQASMNYVDILAEKMPAPLKLKNVDRHFMEKRVPSSLFAEPDFPQSANSISLNSIILSVINGTGWACLPECIAYRFSSICKVLPIKDIDTSHFITMCWRTEPKNFLLNQLTNAIIDELAASPSPVV